MKNILNFLIKIGKLKGKKRRGWLIHKIKNAETTGEHIFHLALLVWVLGKNKKINLERAIKMALIHDICEIYSPDLTSYDAAGLKEKERLTEKEVFKIQPKSGRPTNLQRKKLEKIKQKLENRAIKKLTSILSPELKKEINNLWLDYENGLTSEGRFVKQADRMVNLLQGLEYWKKYGKIEHKLWVRRAKEVIDDSVLLEFLKEIEIEELKRK
ncbi:MAG TPA: HD domain-containing protein [Candidatus Humimicrobiaceae bacterium]|nr:HD domain-containing protein [Candidatus Humimicrobiaceae bacterium]